MYGCPAASQVARRPSVLAARKRWASSSLIQRMGMAIGPPKLQSISRTAVGLLGGRALSEFPAIQAERKSATTVGLLLCKGLLDCSFNPTNSIWPGAETLIDNDSVTVDDIGAGNSAFSE